MLPLDVHFTLELQVGHRDGAPARPHPGSHCMPSTNTFHSSHTQEKQHHPQVPAPQNSAAIKANSLKATKLPAPWQRLLQLVFGGSKESTAGGTPRYPP